ncbi:ComEA family DNA-binding protein [Kitasatospora sp. SUK 42]|uniref:ComEA family DNA-binding protein n=1 Tax=Kitasatospora sp. SUK 42 TaxID=1588882 RepID=UPI0018CA540C|nr:ComEA family DNA-binding protein [Kitasatospora sp. SUK 42]MBV2153942.1 ComEA family DNA-binding protein [Kitasatospora sp. SUK 42]
MTTLSLGAAKRQAINETVRLRMAALLPTDEAPVGDGLPSPSPSPSPSRPPSPPPADEGRRAAAGPPLPASVDPLDLPDPPGGGSRLRFTSALALDRRAVAGLAILLIFAVGYAVQHFWLARPEAVAVPALAVASTSSASSASSAASVPGGSSAAGGTSGAGPPEGSTGPGAEAAVVVDIGGRVRAPGLHTLPGGSRVADALRVAGGPLPETDTRNLNLARILTDGEQILVGEQAPPAALAGGTGGTGGTGGAAVGPPGAGAPRPPVSLNRATAEQLDTLPGVGPTLAQRILAYRTSHGSFRSVDQLRQVSGIGARTFAELRPLLTL